MVFVPPLYPYFTKSHNYQPDCPRLLTWVSGTRKLIIKEFEDSGYDVTYHVLKAVEYGAPQKRERVIIVGFKKELGIKYDFPQPVIANESDYVPLKRVIESTVDEKYYFSQKAVDGMMKKRKRLNIARIE